MKKTKLTRSLLAACSIVALSVVLSGCLHSSDDTTTTDTPTTPTEPPTPPGPTAESLKADAADAITAANAAGEAAEQAEKDAIKYAGMLSAEMVDGESATAVTNAQKVLDAEMAANDAVMDADDALNDAMAAKTAAEALAADAEGRAGAIAAAEEAIKQATAQKKAAMAIVDKAVDSTTDGIQSLSEAVQTIKGANRLAEGYPKMPAAFGKDVADTVKTALGSITRVNTLATLIPDPDPENATRMHDGSGIDAMTWTMIVGEDNVMMERIGASNAAVPVTSIAGMAASAVDKTATPVLAADGGTASDGKYPDGAAQGTATTADGATPGTEYKGIPGAVWCLGGMDGCSVNADGTLSAGWYFTPTSATALYVANPDMAGMYMAAAMYATYGYWLTYDATTDAATGITLYSASTAPQTSLDTGQAGTGDDAMDVTATYSGSAVGISARGDASGQFTATVNLTAKFAVAPTLRGRISNFQGDAVGNWTVVLNETNLSTDGTASFTNGTTAGSGTPGVWTAQGYGPAPVDHDGDPSTTAQNQRPSGFFGNFNANFGDGAAAGAYATRADDQ